MNEMQQKILKAIFILMGHDEGAVFILENYPCLIFIQDEAPMMGYFAMGTLPQVDEDGDSEFGCLCVRTREEARKAIIASHKQDPDAFNQRLLIQVEQQIQFLGKTF